MLLHIFSGKLLDHIYQMQPVVFLCLSFPLCAQFLVELLHALLSPIHVLVHGGQSCYLNYIAFSQHQVGVELLLTNLLYELFNYLVTVALLLVSDICTHHILQDKDKVESTSPVVF